MKVDILYNTICYNTIIYNGVGRMLFSALLVISMINNGSEVINYERIENMYECEKIANEIKNDAMDGVKVLCVLVDPLSEI